MHEKIEPFKKLIEELLNNAKILVEENNLSYTIDKANNMVLEEYDKWIQEGVGIQITHNHLEYMLISGLRLDWTNEKILDDNNTYIYGSFFLHGVLEPIVFPSYFWEVYNDPIEDEKQRETLQKLGYFQRSAHGDDGTFGCFYRESKEYPFPIYFYDNGIYFPMTLNLDKYFEAMLFCKAVVLWQYFYLEPKDIINGLEGLNCDDWISLYSDLEGNPPRVEGIIKHMDVLIRQFPLLFPDFEISFFKNKRDALLIEYNSSN